MIFQNKNFRHILAEVIICQIRGVSVQKLSLTDPSKFGPFGAGSCKMAVLTEFLKLR